MYSTRSSLILGFHGCDQSVFNKILGGQEIRFNKNSYDWLGNGIYFWENSPSRAMEFAENPPPNSKIKNPAVFGAVIDLGYCLDLLNYENIQFLKFGYEALKNSGIPLPTNGGLIGKDFLLRKLDCAVVENIHQINKLINRPPFDSVRGVFWEGEEIYDNAGFKEKSHIQICVRNPNCIKGVFRLRQSDLNHAMV